MAEPRFLLRTDLSGLATVNAAGGPVLERFAALGARLGPAAALFAEPVVTWGNGRSAGSVSWYSALPGDPQPLSSLPPARRAAATARLHARLAGLAPLLAEAEAGPLLRAALLLAGPDSVLVLDEEVVLTGWGLAPPGALATDGARAAHMAQLYGAALPGEFGTAPAASAPAAPIAAPVMPPMPPPAPPSGPPARPPGPYQPIAPGPRPRATAPVWSGWLLPAALLVAILFLGLGFWLGWRLVSERIAQTTLVAELVDEARIARQAALQEDTNRALEQQIEATRRTLEGNVCLAEAGPLPDRPPASRTPVPPAALPPPPAGAAPFSGTLLELLDQATVLVIGPQRDGGIGFGSGFVVAPGIIATNAHVVAQLDPARVRVVNRRLGQSLAAEVVALSSTTPQPGSADFAVLRLPNDAPALQPLGLSRSAARLDPVVAAGFPASIMQTDANFRALLEGNRQAIPEMAVTDGLISAVQPLPSGLVVMPHTAAIGRGNSGGPLADRCGRVVGMNTFGFVDAQQAERVSYAQKAEALLAFLAQHGVAVTEAAGACAQPASLQPGAQPPSAAPAPTPPAPTPPATPPASN
jgi:S1-C subfamily serine protease